MATLLLLLSVETHRVSPFQRTRTITSGNLQPRAHRGIFVENRQSYCIYAGLPNSAILRLYVCQ